MKISQFNRSQFSSSKSNPNFGTCNIGFVKNDLRILSKDATRECLNPQYVRKNLNKLWLNIKKVEKQYKNDEFVNVAFHLENDVDDGEHMVIAHVGTTRKSLSSSTPLAKSYEYETFVLTDGDEFNKSITEKIGSFYN